MSIRAGDVEGKMAISLRNKFVFIHCEKTGGTSIKQWLQKTLDEPLQAWQHFSIGDVKRMIDKRSFKEFFKFSFVRNPWERVVSNYFFCQLPMFRGVNPKLHQTFCEISFKRHVRKRLFLPPCCACLYDKQGNCLMDFVGRYENFLDDLRHVAERLHVSPPQDLPRFNQTEHDHYSTYYDNETRQTVAKFYKTDIENFNYRFETCLG